MRLHQAMLSNAALDIGSINLADMDPEEIQASIVCRGRKLTLNSIIISDSHISQYQHHNIQTELKRVYAQLEMLKTKVMRRDNPHISKRRGGRKTGHRKFSLQAFHAKHIAGHLSNSQMDSDGSQDKKSAEMSSNNNKQLPVLLEQLSSEPSSSNELSRKDRRVQLSEPQSEPHQVISVALKSRQVNSNKSTKSVLLKEPNSLDCESTPALNESQSSGNLSPLHLSSFVCSQSSMHLEDSSAGS